MILLFRIRSLEVASEDQVWRGQTYHNIVQTASMTKMANPFIKRKENSVNKNVTKENVLAE
jgi:hypothetical protein